MDPNMTMLRLVTAICDGDRDTAAAAARDLATWIECGAVLPQNVQRSNTNNGIGEDVILVTNN